MPIKKLIQTLPPRYRNWSSVKVADKLRQVSQHFGENMPPKVSEEEYKMPDTKTATAVTELSRSLNRASIFNHSLRAYCFGICIGKYLNELQYIDREEFYIACMLSKIGLSDAIRDLPEYQGRDFELIGAEHAHAFLLSDDVRYNKLKSDEIHEAIALHTSAVSVEENMAPQLNLLYKAQLLDTVGYYRHDVHRDVLKQIIAKYPRDDFATELRSLYQREMAEKRFAQINEDMMSGLGELIALNTLDDKSTDFPEYPLLK